MSDNETRYAFWGYDLYPYFLGGVIGETGRKHWDASFVYIPSYQGFFKPLLILEGDAGKELLNKARHLKSARRDAERVLREEFNELLRDEAPEIAEHIFNTKQ